MCHILIFSKLSMLNMLNNEDWPVCSSQKMTYVRLWNLELFVQVSKFQGRCLCFFCWNEWRQGIRQTCCQISRRNLPDAAVPLCPCVFFAYIWAKIISISKISETIMWHFDVDGCSTLTQNWKVDECCVPTKKLFKSSALLETFFPQDHLSTSVEEIGCFFSADASECFTFLSLKTGYFFSALLFF